MLILKREKDIYLAHLLQDESVYADEERNWWCVYTMSRREKDLMRKLAAWKIAHYGPIVPKRYRSPAGRLRTSFIPLFPNYIFMLANADERTQALMTNCISKCDVVGEREQLVRDLLQISTAVGAEIPLTPEAKLESGNYVRVRTGPFAGYEGIVIRREGGTRLLLSIQFLEQGVSMELDEAVLEPLD